MKYYKIIKNKEFIGVGTTLNLRRFQNKNEIILICDEAQVQYIRLGDILYRADWMWPETTDSVKYEIADVIRIKKDEYDLLLNAVETNEEIIIEDETVVEYEPVVDEIEELTVDYIRSAKLAELKYECNKAITEGFDMELGDGETRHFTLSVDDQITLLTQAYFNEDMKPIVIEMNNFKTKHMAHLKELEEYVNSLTDIKEIAKVAYRKEDA